MDRKLTESAVATYTHSLWNGKRIVSCYQTLMNYIRLYDQDAASLLARPDPPEGLGINGRIVWYSSVFESETPVLLSQLEEKERQRYQSILSDRLNRFRSIAEDQTDAFRRDMLLAALTFAEESKIYCGNNNVCIVEWGMYPRNSKPIDIFGIYIREKDSVVFPPTAFPSNKNGDIDNRTDSGNETDSGNKSGDGLKDGVNKNSEHSNEYSYNGNPVENVNEDSGSPGNNISRDGDERNRGSDKPSNDSGNLDNPLCEDNHSNPGDQGDDNSNIGGNNSNGSTDSNRNNGSSHFEPPAKHHRRNIPLWSWIVGGGLLSLFSGRNWCWILLLLLLLLLALWLLRSCKRESPYLPDQPGMMKPIVEDDIVDSPDSTRRIVADRINVVISEGGTVVEFAEAFKKAYPAKEYEIVYYDKLIPRAQIQFPKEKREEFTIELPSKLKQFELILFDEALFKNNYTPSDPAFSDVKKKWYFDMIKAYGVWDVTKGSKNLIVAIIDDGFDLNHPELSGKIVKPYNAVTRTNEVLSSLSGHGTHVAGTAIGKMGNGVGTSGISPECMFMPIQVANEKGLMSTTAIIDGVLYAITQGASVVNLSLGMNFNPMLPMMPIGYQRTMIYNSFLEEERVWNQIFAMAEKQGCTLVLAAGNENIMTGIDPMQRNPLGIKVAAIQPDQQKADFSNYGEFSTVSAPGVEIYNAIPGSLYGFMQGTSMASPIVTGGVALLKSKNPKLTSAQIIYILQSTGIPSSSFVGNIIQLDKALAIADRNFDHIPDPQKPQPNNPFLPQQPYDPLNPPTLFPTPNPPEDGNPESGCEKVRKRVEELQHELDYLHRTYPDCLKPAETMKFPSPLTLDKLQGKWKSSTLIFNTNDQQVELFFTFDGTDKARLALVEPDGTEFYATVTLSVTDDMLTMSQSAPAVASNSEMYNPYHFTCRGNRKQEAECVGVNLVEKANHVQFKLLKIN